jgi:hypothetical protein
MARSHPRLLSGDHLQPSLHARMETAEIVHDADPFHNRPALGASREIGVEAPVRGGRRMLEDVGIHPLDDAVHMQHLGRGSKRQLVDFDLVNPRLGARRGRTAQDRGPKVFPFKVFCGERVGDSSTVEQRTLLYSGGGGQALSG